MALNPDNFPKIDVAIDGHELAAWFAKYPPLAPFALRYLMPQEIEYLNASDRCSQCKHLSVLHIYDGEYGDRWCDIDGCYCDDRQ